MEWLVILQGDTSSFDFITTRFSNSQIKIQKIDDRFILTSARFQSLTDPSQVRNEAEPILTFINAAIKISTYSINPINISHVESQENEKKTIYLQDSIKLTAFCSAKVTKYDSNGRIIEESKSSDSPDSDLFSSCIELAENDEKVAKAFKYVCSDFESMAGLHRS